MKGLTFSKLVLIVIGVIIIAISVLLLTGVTALCDSQNPTGAFCDLFSQEKLRMTRYMTCALTKCVNGCDSKRINEGGLNGNPLCLEFDSDGNCAKTCKETCETEGKECGKESGISFTPKKLFVLNSGDANKLGNWFCEQTLWPPKFDWQYLNEGQCNMRKQCIPQGLGSDFYSILSSVDTCGEPRKCSLALIEFDCPIPSSVGIPKSFANEHCTGSKDIDWRLEYCRFGLFEQEDTNEIMIFSKTYGLTADCGVIFVCPS